MSQMSQIEKNGKKRQTKGKERQSIYSIDFVKLFTLRILSRGNTTGKTYS
jgi:hypothetical protein